MLEVAAFIWLMVMLGGVGLSWRVGKVYHYRIDLIKRIHRANLADIQRCRPCFWRYEMFDRVSHNDMLFRFWRPLDSFYDRERLLGPVDALEVEV